jgi:hypothetical protein
VAKQLKDRLRIVQRTARDHFGAIADELHRSLAESVLGAKQAAGSFTTQRDKRIAVLQGQLRQLEQIRKEMPALPPVRVKEVVGR